MPAPGQPHAPFSLAPCIGPRGRAAGHSRALPAAASVARCDAQLAEGALYPSAQGPKLRSGTRDYGGNGRDISVETRRRRALVEVQQPLARAIARELLGAGRAAPQAVALRQQRLVAPVRTCASWQVRGRLRFRDALHCAILTENTPPPSPIRNGSTSCFLLHWGSGKRFRAPRCPGRGCA